MKIVIVGFFIFEGVIAFGLLVLMLWTLLSDHEESPDVDPYSPIKLEDIDINRSEFGPVFLESEHQPRPSASMVIPPSL